jgi:hypothetical protein
MTLRLLSRLYFPTLFLRFLKAGFHSEMATGRRAAICSSKARSYSRP